MIQLGLTRISRLLGSARNAWKAVHVAGTNGKGSVCAYAEAMLVSQGLSVGRFTSPHLIDRWDCIQINGRAVTREEFAVCENFFLQKDQAEQIKATEFELLTATAFKLFAKHNVKVGVVEVGVGGRDDATNILPPSEVLVSVITKIAMDHQSLLGNSTAAIAQHKAGIMKAGVPCVVDGSNELEVMQELQRAWMEHNQETKLALSRPTDSEAWPLHQAQNRQIALDAALIALQRLGINCPSRSALLKAADRVQVPGRLQLVDIHQISPSRGHDAILLDGAHNVNSASVLSQHVDSTLRDNASHQDRTYGRGVTWMIAMSSGKDARSILRVLLRPGDSVIATGFHSVDGMPWVKPMEPAKLLEEAQRVCKIGELSKVEIDSRKALVLAAEAARAGPLVIAGSLYLVSDIHRMLRHEGVESHDSTADS